MQNASSLYADGSHQKQLCTLSTSLQHHTFSSNRSIWQVWGICKSYAWNLLTAPRVALFQSTHYTHTHCATTCNAKSIIRTAFDQHAASCVSEVSDNKGYPRVLRNDGFDSFRHEVIWKGWFSLVCAL